MTNSGSPSERPRIDKWLWCARFYKSRALASDAVAGGRVHLNGERVKPAHSVRAGDQIEITRGSESWTIRVLAIPVRRDSASAAARCYEEAADSIARREAGRAQRRLVGGAPPRPPAKPDKRSRRALLRLLRQR
jgi:ribosome-associated heat shock protein Hsp15